MTPLQFKSTQLLNGRASKLEPRPPKTALDSSFTANVIAATGPKAHPRVAKTVGSLIQHLHDWARENEITVDEWMAGVELINQSGKMSTDRRNEGQMLCDVIGLESLVDSITTSQLAHADSAPTASAILGPFWRADAPRLPMRSSIVHGIPDGDHTYMYGRVVDHKTGQGIEGAELDIWHTAPNGLYEQQDPSQPDMNLRGRFTTPASGEYAFYCLRPTSYPIPDDGPAGRLLALLDRHPMRPAHIHLVLKAPGYRPLTTQIFDRRDRYVTDDAVFAVKEELVVDFLERKGDPKAQFQLEYDFKLAKFID
ncbi:MAG: hypothetical protein M1824_005196 [Vezdaea acicularis]|nr:MAG: hypothetical protein M1824_005196 [Vezdaea acicularis]